MDQYLIHDCKCVWLIHSHLCLTSCCLNKNTEWVILHEVLQILSSSHPYWLLPLVYSGFWAHRVEALGLPEGLQGLWLHLPDPSGVFVPSGLSCLPLIGLLSTSSPSCNTKDLKEAWSWIGSLQPLLSQKNCSSTVYIHQPTGLYIWIPFMVLRWLFEAGHYKNNGSSTAGGLQLLHLLCQEMEVFREPDTSKPFEDSGSLFLDYRLSMV